MSRSCLSSYPRLLGIRDAVFTALGNFAHNAFITKIKELSVPWPSFLILLSIVSVSLGGITLECLTWKAAIWDLFHGASKAVNHVKMKLNPFPRPSAARSSLEGRWTQPSDFSMRSTWPQEQLLVFWVNGGKGCDRNPWWEQHTRFSFPWDKVSWPAAEYACCWVRGVLVIEQGELGRGNTSLFWGALWMPIWVLSTYLLERERERDSWRDR